MLSKEISSLQHPIVKMCVKLRTSKKARAQSQQVLIAGIKQISEMDSVEILFVKKGFSFSCEAKQTYFITETLLKKITGLQTPEPVAAIVPLPKWDTLEGKSWILGLDGIADPGNLGTLLRTACGLGWEGAFLTPSCVDPYNDKALRSAKGATFRLPLRLRDASELKRFAQDENMTTWIADVTGPSLKEAKPGKKNLLILGSEAQGVSIELKNTFNTLSIPMNQMESLNVAAAGAIFMYHLKS